MTNAKMLLERITASGVKSTLTPEGTLKIDAPKGVLTAEQRDKLKQYKVELLDLLQPKIKQSSGNELNEKNETTLLSAPLNCPLCTIKLKADDCRELIIRFCPLGCSFVWRAIGDLEAAVQLLKKLWLDDSFNTINYNGEPYDRNGAMRDALKERAAILEYNGISRKTAKHTARQELFAVWLDEYRLARGIRAEKL